MIQLLLIKNKNKNKQIHTWIIVEKYKSVNIFNVLGFLKIKHQNLITVSADSNQIEMTFIEIKKIF